MVNVNNKIKENWVPDALSYQREIIKMETLFSPSKMIQFPRYVH